MNEKKAIYAAIETGGTKFVCSIGNSSEILDTITLPTLSPNDTFSEVVSYLNNSIQSIGELSAIGIASFGPLGINPDQADYGKIQSTPKPGWSQADILEPFRQFNVPMSIDTDVNVAALGEACSGAGAGKRLLAYATIGTGIGVGICVDGKILNGHAHPEMGHIRVPQNINDSFEGSCPYHKDCLEGLAAGPAIEARWGKDLSALPATHEAYQMEAAYIGHLCTNLLLSYSPDIILLGGGVMKADGLIEKIRDSVFDSLNGYLAHIDTRKKLDVLITKPMHFGQSALIGAFIMAESANAAAKEIKS